MNIHATENWTKENLSIINFVEGSYLNLKDSSDNSIEGLNIYGKTTQEGDPTIENPQDLINVGNSGSITTNVCGKNMLPYPYKEKPKTENGITWSVNDNGSIAVSGTATGYTAFLLYDGANIFPSKYTFALNEIATMNNLALSITYYNGNTSIYTAGISVTYNNLINVDVSALEEEITKVTIAIKRNVNNTEAKGSFYPVIVANSADIAYEPYKEPQTLTLNTPNGLPGVPVSSGGNYTDENGQQWICDEIDLARGKYIQRVEKITLNRNTPISIDAPSETRTYAVAYISGISPYVNNGIGFGYCNKLVYGNYSNNNKQEQFYPYDNGRDKGFSISLHKDRFDGTYKKAKVLEILGNDNVFIYAMAEPIETDLELTEEEITQYKALTTHKPYTNIINDANAYMKVDYVADTKNYIDNKISEKYNNLQSAVLSLGGEI